MQVYKMSSMKQGWFVGDFEPTAFKTNAFEVAVKYYNAGCVENKHVHKVATEITLILSGNARVNGADVSSGDIVVLNPTESSVFETTSEVVTVVVKSPSVIGDKYML